MWLQEVRGQERYRSHPQTSSETFTGTAEPTAGKHLTVLPAQVSVRLSATYLQQCSLLTQQLRVVLVSQTKMSASRSEHFLLMPKYSLKFFTDFSVAPPLHTVHPVLYQHLGASVHGITNNAWQKLIITSQDPTTGEIISFWSTCVLTYLCHKCVKALVELSVRWPLLPVDQSEGRGTAYM